MNQISAFEYISILVSLILGLGITQILSAFSDLLYDFKKVKFYWPHSIWIFFISFLHIQDWFITWQLRSKLIWNLPELFFVLIYPITLFTAAKILLPNHAKEESEDMKAYYQSQAPLLFILVAISIFTSILFNWFFLEKNIFQQIPLLLFLVVMIGTVWKKVSNETWHKAIAVALLISSILSIILEKDVWVIK
jgi:hypothetical protein